MQKIFISAIMAGFSIGLGGTVFLRIKDAFPGGNVVGALLFSVGLFVVCTRAYALYTGKVCYIFDNDMNYFKNIGIIWLGNLVGTGIIAGAERMTTICGPKGIDTVAATMVASKMGSDYLSLFLLGALCNIFIFIGVNGYAKNPHEVGKYLAIILGVACFILCGREHCIADMYYWWVSGVMMTDPVNSLICIAVITLGNLLGGVMFPVVEKYI